MNLFMWGKSRRWTSVFSLLAFMSLLSGCPLEKGMNGTWILTKVEDLDGADIRSYALYAPDKSFLTWKIGDGSLQEFQSSTGCRRTVVWKSVKLANRLMTLGQGGLECVPFPCFGEGFAAIEAKTKRDENYKVLREFRNDPKKNNYSPGYGCDLETVKHYQNINDTTYYIDVDADKLVAANTFQRFTFMRQ